jgi:ribitol-5-phosphate 2-dehydrogenase (NADP+)
VNPATTVPSTVYRLTRPFRLEAFEEPTPPIGPGDVLLRPVRAGICGSDLKLYSGARERSALLGKLPIALLHEATAEVVEAGPGVGLSVGQLVVPSPNIPCTIAHSERHPTIEEACHACRPGGIGSNYCVDGDFLSSNTDGMARTAFVHPAACTVPVPPTVSEAVVVLTEPLATVLAGLEQVAPGAERFIILGNGAIGILTALALTAIRGVRPQQILMTGRHWESRAQSVEGLATVIDDDGLARDRSGWFDVAFECVGGESNAETLGLALELLRPGGTGILFGPSEHPLLLDTRKMIGKGLRLVGCNRARIEHFRTAIELAGDPDVSHALERTLAPKEFTIQSVTDLDNAFYYAWTKSEPGRAVTVWREPRC